MNKNSYQKYILITSLLSIVIIILISFSFREEGHIRDIDREDVGDGDHYHDGSGDIDNDREIGTNDRPQLGNNRPRPGNNNRPNNNRRPVITRPSTPRPPGSGNNNNNNNGNNNGNNNLGPDELSMSFTESENGIRMINAMPMSDAIGMVLSGSNEMFDFTVNSRVPRNSSLEYEIAIIKDPSSTLSNDEVRLYLTRIVGTREQVVSGPISFTEIPTESPVGASAGSMIMQRITITESANTRYRLRLWVAEGTPINNESRTFSVTVNVYGRSVN